MRNLLALLLFVPSLCLAQLPDYVPLDGLVGWYPFNGNSNDGSGNGNDGIVDGDPALLPSFVYDTILNRQVIQFDDIDDELTISAPGQLGFSNEFTFSCWLNPNEEDDGQVMSMDGGRFSFYGTANHFDAQSSTSWASEAYYCGWNNHPFVHPEGWYQMTITISSDSIKTFGNGQFIVGLDCGGQSTFDTDIIFGYRNMYSTGDYHWGGQLADCGIWNRALNEAEVQALFLGAPIEYGCTDLTACNYDATAEDDDGSCVYAEDLYGVPYVDCEGNCLNDLNNNGVCDEDDQLGCTVQSATNFDPMATVDDGSCSLSTILDLIAATENLSDFNDYILNTGWNTELSSTSPWTVFAPSNAAWTTTPNLYLSPLLEYDSLLNEVIAFHITNDSIPSESFYNGLQIQMENGDIRTYSNVGEWWNQNASLTGGNGSSGIGETDLIASNGVIHILNDVSLPNSGAGCTDTFSCNFNPLAGTDDGSCEFESCAGCTNTAACNYDSLATIAIDSICTFPADIWGVDYVDCSGQCISSTQLTSPSGSSPGEYGIQVEVIPNIGPIAGYYPVDLTGYSVFRVFITMENEDDFLSAITGDIEHPTYITTTTQFYHSVLGSVTPSGINPILFDSFPDLQYDSWITIGLSSIPNVSLGEANISIEQSGSNPWITNFDPGGGDIVINDPVGGAWFALNGDANGVAGSELKVLAGQFVTDGDVEIQLYTQIFINGNETAPLSIDSILDQASGTYDMVYPTFSWSSLDHTLPYPDVFGCIDSTACNFNECANTDDGSCEYGCLYCGEGTMWDSTLAQCVSIADTVFIEPEACAPSCGEGTVWDPINEECIIAVPTDNDFDGCVSASDVLNLLSTFGTCPPYPEWPDEPTDTTWTCGDPLTYWDYDYATVLIGDQCWFAENLRTELYSNGDSIPSGLTDAEWANTISGATAIYGEGSSICGNGSPDIDACDELQSLEYYGRLYNGYAVNDERGLCLEGWHVSTEGDWTILENHVAAQGFAGMEGTVLKSTTGWYNNGNGTDEFGFSALPGGYRSNGTSGNYINAGIVGHWWSTLEVGTRTMAYTGPDLSLSSFSAPGGFSVRCIKD